MDYIRAVTPISIPVVINGGMVNVARANFGLHIRLSELSLTIAAEDDPVAQASMIFEYLSLAGVPDVSLSGAEALAAYLGLTAGNRLYATLPFLDINPGEDDMGEPPPYDYKWRHLARWVHTLSTRYGWTRDYIFTLSPEEVFCYLQEIYISEYTEGENARALSELSYRYDEGSKTSNFVPSPKPDWMMPPPIEQEPQKVLKSMLPVGAVVDLSGMNG